MSRHEAERPPEDLSEKAQAFMSRPHFPMALWLGAVLLGVILCCVVASLFIKDGTDKSLARSVVQMFLRR